MYEELMKQFKLKYSKEQQEKYEFLANMVISALAGVIGSAVTNSFDVLTINKQANPNLSLLGLI